MAIKFDCHIKKEVIMKNAFKRSYALKRNRSLIIPFLLPGFIVYSIFFIIPAVQGLYFGFFDWKGFSKEKTFIGLQNFKELFKDSIFWDALALNIRIMIFGGIGIFILAFIFLICYNNIKHMKKGFRGMIFLPQVISPVAICILWNFIFNPRFGLLNNILSSIGLDSLTRAWMAPANVIGAMIFVIMWTYVGFYFVILVSGVSKIPNSVFESALIEGASPIRVFFSITIPMIWDVFTIAVIYWMVTSLKMFELIFSFTGFKPLSITWNLPVYIYILGFGKNDAVYRVGYASAVALILTVLVMVFVIISRRAMKRDTLEY